MAQTRPERYFRNATDDELVAMAQGASSPSNAKRAQDELIRRYEPAIKKTVGGLEVHGPDFQDALQGGRIGFLTAIGRYDPNHGASLATFAHSHVWGSALREVYRARGWPQDGSPKFSQVPFDTLDDDSDDEAKSPQFELVAAVPGADEQYEASTTWGVGELEVLVRQLSDRQRQLIHTIYVLDQSMADVARAEGTSRAAVSQRHVTVVRQLKSRLTREESRVA